MAMCAGISWAQTLQLTLLVKFSRRFVPVLPWAPALQRLASMSQYATYSGHSSAMGYGFVTNCLAFHVPSWEAWLPALRDHGEGVVRHHPENFVHGLAQRIHAQRLFLTAAYEAAHPKLPDRQGYGEWPLAVEDHETRPDRLWYVPNPLTHYARVAECWGLPYSLADFSTQLDF